MLRWTDHFISMFLISDNLALSSVLRVGPNFRVPRESLGIHLYCRNVMYDTGDCQIAANLIHVIAFDMRGKSSHKSIP